MVGQALGARKPERAEAAVKIAGKYNMIVLTAIGVLLAFGAPLIARLFSSDPNVASVATNLLRLVACGFPFYGWGMVYSQSFNGAGDTRTPTLLNLAVFWCWEIPLAYVLAVAAPHGAIRRLSRDGDRVLDVRGGGQLGVQTRNLEAPSRLTSRGRRFRARRRRLL